MKLSHARRGARSARRPVDCLVAVEDRVARIGALDRTLAAPFGEVPAPVFLRFLAFDGLVHSWDLATATGQSFT